MIVVKGGSSSVQRILENMDHMKHMLHKLMIIVLGFLAGLPLFTLSAPAANAQATRSSDEHDDAQKAVRRGEIKSYAEIKRLVEERLDGRVVDLKLRRTNLGWQYFLRISKENGRVVAAVVDAKTGKILTTN